MKETKNKTSSSEENLLKKVKKLEHTINVMQSDMKRIKSRLGL